jgi:hypothetical protein
MPDITPNFPDILAVDPQNCACLECITGEYVNEDVWSATANAADLYRLLKGEVANNTYQPLYRFVIDSYFRDDSASDFVDRLKDEISYALEHDTSIDIDSAYNNVSF